MSEVMKNGKFQFTSIRDILENGPRTPETPVSERTNTICSSDYHTMALLTLIDHEKKEAMKNHIILYSTAGIIVPSERTLLLAQSRGARPAFSITPTGIAYGQIKEVTPEVLDELRIENLERLTRAMYRDVTPDGWCTILIGNLVRQE